MALLRFLAGLVQSVARLPRSLRGRRRTYRAGGFLLEQERDHVRILLGASALTPAAPAGLARLWRRGRGPRAAGAFLIEEDADLVRVLFDRRRQPLTVATATAPAGLAAQLADTSEPAPRRLQGLGLPKRSHPVSFYIPAGIAAAVIPAHNEESVIEATLRSVLGCYHKEDIFVFCDGCTDATVTIARRYLPPENVIDNQQNVGKSKGLERVFREQILPRGYVYMTTVDADTTIEPAFLVNTLKALRYRDVACVVGQVKSRWYATNVISIYRTYVYTVWQMFYKRLQSWTNSITIASGCSTTWKTRILAQLEFDHLMSTEDFSLTIQVHRMALGRIKYVASAVVWTQDPFSIASYRKQSYRWERAWWESVRKYQVGIRWLHLRRNGLPIGLSALDISTLLLTFDILVFMASVVFLPLFLLRPVHLDVGLFSLNSRMAILESVGWQYLSVVGSALFVSIYLRKPRIFFYSPVFIFLMYLDVMVSVKAIASTIRRQYRFAKPPTNATAVAVWASPERREVH